MSVYVDTSAFYAIVDVTDSNNSSATSTWQRLLLQDEILITSSYVVTETVALLHSRFGTDVVRRFVEDNLSAVEVLWTDRSVYALALDAMLAIAGKRGPSLTDCASVVIMRQTDTQRIFAYDQHFENLGFELIG